MNKICGSSTECRSQERLLFTKGGYPIYECNNCGHRFSDIPDVSNHVASVYSDDYFFAGKDGYSNYLDNADILFKHGKRYARIVSKFTNPGKILDVGCAAGRKI